jgi:hypothetical protein
MKRLAAQTSSPGREVRRRRLVGQPHEWLKSARPQGGQRTHSKKVDTDTDARRGKSWRDVVSAPGQKARPERTQAPERGPPRALQLSEKRAAATGPAPPRDIGQRAAAVRAAGNAVLPLPGVASARATGNRPVLNQQPRCTHPAQHRFKRSVLPQPHPETPAKCHPWDGRHVPRASRAGWGLRAASHSGGLAPQGPLGALAFSAAAARGGAGQGGPFARTHRRHTQKGRVRLNSGRLLRFAYARLLRGVGTGTDLLTLTCRELTRTKDARAGVAGDPGQHRDGMGNAQG